MEERSLVLESLVRIFIAGCGQTRTGFTVVVLSAKWLLLAIFDGNVSGVDLEFYKGGCPIHLKGAPEVEGVGVWGESFCISYIKMVRFMHSWWYLLTL